MPARAHSGDARAQPLWQDAYVPGRRWSGNLTTSLTTKSLNSVCRRLGQHLFDQGTNVILRAGRSRGCFRELNCLPKVTCRIDYNLPHQPFQFFSDRCRARQVEINRYASPSS